MPDEQNVPAAFPTKGEDVSCEFGRQPDSTSPDALNVRSYDVFLARNRGGSRPMLVKWINDRVNGDSLVQHLNILVDPTTAALAANEIPAGVTTTTDPLTGDLVRAGGSGVQTNVNVNPVQAGSSGLIEYVQSTEGQYSSTDPDVATVTLNDPPESGSLILVVVLVTTDNQLPLPGRQDIAPEADGVKNSAGDLYTQIEDPTTYASGGPINFDDTYIFGDTENYYSLSMWYKYATSGAPDQDVTINSPIPGDLPDNCRVSIFVFEYRNAAGGPVDFQKNQSATNVSNWTIPTLSLSNVPGSLVFCVFACGIDNVENPPTAFPLDQNLYVLGAGLSRPNAGLSPIVVSGGTGELLHFIGQAVSFDPELTPNVDAGFAAMAVAFDPA